MHRYSQIVKKKAIRLRKNGFSMNEISRALSISKSTASLWIRHISLSVKAQERLTKRTMDGKQQAILKRSAQREILQKQYENEAKTEIRNIKINRHTAKLLTALLYFCEGAKREQKNVTFINSDPLLIKLFLTLFRTAFPVEEKKFRLLMHLHDYHDEAVQKKFWASVTSIPSTQFMKTYRKKNTQIRLRDAYPGCVSLRYYDAQLAKRLHAMYRVFAQKVVKY